MKVVVLGSAAGGGFPQWNCTCRNCRRLRDGTLQASSCTQSSIAISQDSESWVLTNASPDILAQIKTNPILQPARRLRDTRTRAIVLVDAQVAHTTGLFMLREGDPLEVYRTRPLREDLKTANPIFNVLGSYCGVNRRPVPVEAGESFSTPGFDGLRFTAVPVAGKAPPFAPHRENPRSGDNIGLAVEGPVTDGVMLYAPGLGEIDRRIASEFERADCLMVDGTCWTDDVLARAGVGHKRALDMGHLAQAGGEWRGCFSWPIPRA